MALPLSEKYRPKTLQECVGQAGTIDAIKRITADGFNGQVFFFVCKSGTGKTSICRILANQATHPAYVNSWNAARLNVEKLDWINKTCRYGALGEDGKPTPHVFLIDESHLLRGPILGELNTLLEEPHVVRNSFWMFTTTFAGERKLFDEDEIERVPFASRCKMWRMNYDEQVTLAFALRARDIARAENLDGRPLEEYIAMIRRHNWNLREVLQSIEMGEMLVK